MLVVIMNLLLQIRYLVLLYRCASYYYIRHGGSSDVGTSCGMFFIRVDGTINGSNWDYGAALDCVILLC